MECDFGVGSAPHSPSSESYVSPRKTRAKTDKKAAGKKKRGKSPSTDSHAFTDIPISIALTSFTDF